jgi:hypothetical protein
LVRHGRARAREALKLSPSEVNGAPRKASNRLATALGAQHLPSRYWRGDALDLDGAETAVLEEITDQPARARGDDKRVGAVQRLQTGGEVRYFADD